MGVVDSGLEDILVLVDVSIEDGSVRVSAATG